MEKPRVFYHKGGLLNGKRKGEAGWYYKAPLRYMTDEETSSLHCYGKQHTGTGFGSKRAAERALAHLLETRKWHLAWDRAWGNTPHRFRTVSDKNWVSRKPGSTTLPELIKGQAKGTLRQFEGLVQQLDVVTERRQFGKFWAFCVLLGGNRRAKGCYYNSKPKSLEKLKLLLKLADSKKGKEYAMNVLIGMGRGGWGYTYEDFES